MLELSQKLYEEGYHYITNSDYSPVIIEEMKERNSHLDDMDCNNCLLDLLASLDVEMNITEPLEILDSDSFTCIVDKGTFDCVVCSEQYLKKTKQMLENIHRILAPGGCYLCVSYGKPETRMGYFKNDGYKWQVEMQKVQKKINGAPGGGTVELFERIDQEPFYYVYICTKKY